MNLLGPLANPAGVRRQVIGVSSPDRAPLVAEALARLGAAHALVLHAAVGMDEVSPSGETRVWEVREGRVATWTIAPGAHGLDCDDLGGLAGGEPAENADRLERLLAGRGPGGGALRRVAQRRGRPLRVGQRLDVRGVGGAGAGSARRWGRGGGAGAAQAGGAASVRVTRTSA